jgi:hypothetical protein
MARTHGKPATYSAGGCRCPRCTKGWREYRRVKERERRARLMAADPEGYRAKMAADQRARYRKKKEKETNAAGGGTG